METGDPFDLLLDIERRCQANAAGLPTLDIVEDEWVGVGFRIGKDKLIAPMYEIEEILDLPEFTYVPGVKSWMVGVANVRGGLLHPVVAVMQHNVAKAKEIIVELARATPDPTGRPATSALAGAIITNPDSISPDVRDKLRPLIGNYIP